MKNNSKRILALLLAIVMCVSCVVPVFAETAAHDHEDAPETVMCPGKSKEHTSENSKYSPVLDEKTGEPVVVAPQCGTWGYSVNRCDVCQTPVYTNWVAPIGGADHPWGEWVVETLATCTEAGLEVRKCTTPGCEGKETRDLEPLGHDFPEAEEKKFNCWEGTEAYDLKCARCDEVEHVEAVAPHACDRYVVSIDEVPNCETAGVATVKCNHDHCNYESKEVVVEALNGGAGHDWEVKEITAKPTCGKPGSGIVECPTCGAEATVVDGVIATVYVVAGLADTVVEYVHDAFKPTGTHNYEGAEIVGKTDSRCDAEGKEAHKLCVECNSAESAVRVNPETGDVVDGEIVIAKKPHVWGELVPAVPHTCTVDGNVAYYSCTECGAYSLDQNTTVAADAIVDKAEHSYKIDGEPVAKQEPTCFTFGLYFYGCTICGTPADNSNDVVENLPADQEGWVAPGVKRIPMLAHDYKEIVEVEGDCVTDRVVSKKCVATFKDKNGDIVACTHSVKETTPAPGHKYAPSEALSKIADCQSGGYTIDACACGDVRKDETTDEEGRYNITSADPSKHAWTYISTTDAKCDKLGVELPYCPTCNEYGEPRVVEMIPHEKGEFVENKVVVEPTCTTSGATVNVYKCTMCEQPVVEEPGDDIAALGHDLVDVAGKAANCTEPGFKAYKQCSRCVYMEGFEAIPALNHEGFVAERIDMPTCNAKDAATLTGTPGAKVTYCTECGHEFSSEPIEFEWNNPEHHTNAHPTGYSWQEGTCEVIDYSEYKCDDCGREFHVITNTIGDHDDSGITTPVKPTCTEPGAYAHFECSICNKTFYVNEDGENVYYDAAKNPNAYVIPALGHDLVDVAGQDATCTEPGYKAYKDCSRCDHTEGYEVIDALGHDMVDAAGKDATCTEPGYTDYKDCSRCDHIEGKDVIPAIEHAGKDVVVGNVGCADHGYVYYYCALCGEEWINGFEHATGHVFGEEIVEAPTCKEGILSHYNCSVCGGNYATNEDIYSKDAMESIVDTNTVGHVNKNGETLENKCNNDVEDRICVGCGDTIGQDHIDLIRHSVNATCTEFGYKTAECRFCGDVTPPYDIVEALGHSYGWEITENPGIFTDGKAEWQCTVCGDKNGEPTEEDIKNKPDVSALGGIEFSYAIDNAFVSGAEYVNGGRIKLTIYYKAVDVSLNSVALALNYNANVLSFVSGGFICNAIGTDGNSIFNADGWTIGGAEPGYVVVLADTFAPMSAPVDKTLNGEDVFAELYFNIKQNTPANSTFDFAINSDSMIKTTEKGEDGFMADVTADFGTVSNDIKTQLLGDINGDGKYTNADKVEFLDIAYDDPNLENKSDENPTGEVVYLAIADINQDGFINLLDYKALLNRVAHSGTDEDLWAEAQK